MNDQTPQHVEDAELDRLLASHVAGELQHHVGRAEHLFRAQHQQARRQWTVPMGLAAALMLALGGGLLIQAAGQRHSRESARKVSDSHQSPHTALSTQAPIEQDFITSTTDIGEFEIDGLPTRAYRTELIQQTETYDPQTQITIRTSTPSEQLVFVTLEHY